MKSELSFLIDMLLTEKLPAEICKLLAKRIREVEEHMTKLPAQPTYVPPPVYGPRTVAPPGPSAQGVTQQAPSMQRVIEQHPDVAVVTATPPPTPPQPVTQAAAQALRDRAAILSAGLKDKPESGRTSPRKF